MTPNRVEHAPRARQVRRLPLVGLLSAYWSLCAPSLAHASLLPPEMEDALAKYIAIFVLFFVPVLIIVLFWLVHIMPEKIAHKRHHPQFEAIRTLCLLSLVFGGLLWPLAWIWAYTKPVGYKLAYGTDKHPDYFKDHGLPEPEDPAADIKRRMADLESRGVPASDLEGIRADLVLIESRLEAAKTPSEVK